MTVCVRAVCKRKEGEGGGRHTAGKIRKREEKGRREWPCEVLCNPPMRKESRQTPKLTHPHKEKERREEDRWNRRGSNETTTEKRTGCSRESGEIKGRGREKQTTHTSTYAYWTETPTLRATRKNVCPCF